MDDKKQIITDENADRLANALWCCDGTGGCATLVIAFVAVIVALMVLL
jgi:hypothetical protein